jgi:hypothetical protein
MANKKTTRARKAGFCSSKDQNENGNKIFTGTACDTSWDAKASKHRSRKIYRKQPIPTDD